MVFGLTIDKLSVLIGVAVILVGFLIVVYSTGYLSPQNREHPETSISRRYYVFLLLFIGSMAGLVYSSTILGLLIFFELTGVCSWGLIGYYDSEKARKAALKAIIVTQVASLGLYAAAALLFAATNSLRLTDLTTLTGPLKTIIFLGVFNRRVWKISSITLPFLAARCDGGSYPDQRLLTCRFHGQGGRLHICPLPAFHCGCARNYWRSWKHHGYPDHAVWLCDVFPAKGYQETVSLLNHHAAGLYFPGAFIFGFWISSGF